MRYDEKEWSKSMIPCHHFHLVFGIDMKIFISGILLNKNKKLSKAGKMDIKFWLARKINDTNKNHSITWSNDKVLVINDESFRGMISNNIEPIITCAWKKFYGIFLRIWLGGNHVWDLCDFFFFFFFTIFFFFSKTCQWVISF